MKSLPPILTTSLVLGTLAIPSFGSAAESISVVCRTTETSKGFAIYAVMRADLRLNLTDDTAKLTGKITLTDKSGAKRRVNVNEYVTFRKGAVRTETVTVYAENYPSDAVSAVCDVTAWIEDTGRTGRTDHCGASLELPRQDLVVGKDGDGLPGKNGKVRRVTYRQSGDNEWTVKANFRRIGVFVADPVGGYTARSSITDREGSSNDLEEILDFLLHEFQKRPSV